VARIPDDHLERLRAEVSLVSLVQAHGVELRRAGADLVGRCPFHDDTTPSLVVTPGKNLWHCLGACQAGGSVVDWVMRAQGRLVPACGGTAPRRHAHQLAGRGGCAEALVGSQAPDTCEAGRSGR
jgi:hypothetical protein